MKKLNLYLSVVVTTIMAAILFVTAAVAQDPGAQAAQQAIQMQQQQATQQAIQMQQQAAQQAAQDSPSIYYPPQNTPPTVPLQPTGPVPAQVAAAHKIMFTSVGASPNFPLDAGQAYNDVYADLQSWGYYQLVSTPQEADLIFQLREVAPLTDIVGGRGYVYTTHTPAFVLTMIDPKTQVTLWSVTSPVYLAGKKDVYAHWVALSEANLVSRIKVVAGQQLTGGEQADLVTYPKNHYRRNALIITGVAVGALAATAVIVSHDMKSNQDAFCAAHNIPANMCAGG